MVANAVLSVVKEKNVELRCIIGPVISVNDRKENILLYLALEGKIKLYLSRKRIREHYRVFGERMMWLEKEHDTLQVRDRLGMFIYPNSSEGNNVFTYMSKFDALVDKNEVTKVSRPDQIISLNSNEFDLMRGYLHRRNLSFNELDVLDVLPTLEKSKKEKLDELTKKYHIKFSIDHFDVITTINDRLALNYLELESLLELGDAELKEVIQDLEKENFVKVIKGEKNDSEIIIANREKLAIV